MELLVISLVTFFAAILTFFSGFGLATILTPVMLLFFPPEIAIFLTGIIHFLNNIYKLTIVGKKINISVIIKFGVPAILASYIGSSTLFFISESTFFTHNLFTHTTEISYVDFTIPIILILFALIDLIPFLQKIKFNNSVLPLGGFLSGFFGGLTGNQGALRSAFLIKLNLDKTVFIATTVVISFFVDLTRVSVYLFKVNGLDISNYFIVGSFAVASAILGSLIGNKLLKKVTLGFIRNLVAMMILIIATLLMIGLL